METTVVKGFKVLEALARSPGSRTLTDLAAECGMSKSNVHRLLRTLEECGYVGRDVDARTYRATLRLWELGVRVYSRLDLRTYAVRHLRELAELTEETTHLSVFDGEGVLYLDKVDGIHAVRTYVNVGDRAPAYCSSTGKAILAYLPDETIRRVSSDLKPFTENTVRTPAQLRADLELIRQRGYSETRGEYRPGVLGFSAAIRSPSGEPLGAIGVAGPEERMQLRDLDATIAAVLTAARRIEADLGFGPTPSLGETEPVKAAAKSTAKPRRKAAAE
ncbi:transcriptional regulator [Kaistia sp. 32K]|uniref:IclR family transcriptional regulator n=1 Tax=Kaistia sp. 32K TaxID=2795690 RepID=UPI0019156DBD|nr:IclR family transcriptional regulator [Kaistia sp. 32K]BCP52169.1 transcriptional regulator [Kaistia sp. 32K]